MTRDEVQTIVTRHLDRAVGGIEGAVDPEASMKDYGATSLDLVEIVSASMREMKVKVPRKELADIANLAGLVDLLHRVWIEKYGATSAG